MINSDKKYLYADQLKNSSIEQKVLFLTALETHQNRYLNQVQVPFISDDGKREICERLSSVFNEDEEVQKVCALHFSNKRLGPISFSAMGMVDVLKDDTVYELKFVSELSHEHFLQCAIYMIALDIKKGILWNVRKNEM